MYHALLTNRYLTSRVIPLIAVAAVALCVALVIVVVSVMTGFLNMVKDSGRTLMGDVVISYPVSGIPHYERLIERIERLPEAAAATPVVDSFGLLKMPYPDGPAKQTEVVQIWGIEPRGFAKVTGYEKTLHWQNLSDDQWRRLFGDVLLEHSNEVLAGMTVDQRVSFLQAILLLDRPSNYELPPAAEIRERISSMSDEEWQQIFRVARHDPETLQGALSDEQWRSLMAHDPRLLEPGKVYEEGLTLEHNGKPGIAMGMHVSEGNERQRDGTYQPMQNGYWWMLRFKVTLTTLPITGGGLADPEHEILQVVNEFVSGVFLIDDKRVMVPLNVAQRMLHLDAGELVDEDDPTRVLGIDPAKATMVLVRAVDGVTPEQLRGAVAQAYEDFYDEIRMDMTAVVKPPSYGEGAGGVSVRTWAQQQAQFIGPVEKERELMRTLFSIVYLVCAALVLSIFWAIVYEKTRDIGILRSIGASRSGIVWIFLRYGLVVGVVGSIVGVGLGFLIIHNINHIHSALADPPLQLAVGLLILAGLSLVLTIALGLRGNLLPIVVGTLGTIALLGLGAGVWMLHRAGGVIIWDPSVYYFTKIPNTIDVATAITTVIGAIIFSLLGAVIPAAKAADTDPVNALRYE